MYAERRRQRGQALIEALVAMIVLVPLAVLLVLLGKFQSMQQATILASRTLAFECTVRIERCSDPHALAVLVDELRVRHFGRIDREILSEDRVSDPAADGERNPLWSEHGGRPLLERFADVGGATSPQRFDAGLSVALGRAAVADPSNLLGSLAGPSRFGLDVEAGMIDARIQVSVSPSRSGNQSLSKLGSLPLTMRARTVVLTDAWNASLPYGGQPHTVEQRVEAGRRLDGVRETAIGLGYQLSLWTIDLMSLIGLEPAADGFQPYAIDVDRIPIDRIGP
ncbi:MAG: hypothetical protein AB7F71_20305 [Burkholderiaceae bacterium]